jgi:hypothetical protein
VNFPRGQEVGEEGHGNKGSQMPSLTPTSEPCSLLFRRTINLK